MLAAVLQLTKTLLLMHWILAVWLVLLLMFFRRNLCLRVTAFGKLRIF